MVNTEDVNLLGETYLWLDKHTLYYILVRKLV
jgi:hypothetical protein